MKNAALLLATLLLCLVFLFGCNKNEESFVYLSDPPTGGYLGEYDITNYECQIEQFPSEKNVGPITDADDAIEKGVLVLTELYGAEEINDEKPFAAYYDPNSDTWLIRGSLPPAVRYSNGYSFVPMGGVAKIIINTSDGDVIAVWHEA